MKVTWWGGPRDGEVWDVPRGVHHVIVAEDERPFDWARETKPEPTELRKRAFLIHESDPPDGRLWLVWREAPKEHA
jgi:hypothetical protein